MNFSQLPKWGQTTCKVLVAVFALMVLQCARLGTAGLLVQTAQSEVDQWSPTAPRPGKTQIAHLTKSFGNSLRLVSDNPWALEGLGTVDLARMRASRIPREALADAKTARQHFRLALAQRPTSPFLWANLALAKLYLDERDAEFFSALRHANELGPWEQTVQQTTLFAGLAAWQELDPELQQTMARIVERGAARIDEGIFKIVKSYGRYDLVCAIKKYETMAAPFCKSAEAASRSGEALKRR